MRGLKRLTVAGLSAGALLAQSATADAQSVVAQWIQLGPGSSPAALANGSYGDQPTSLTPTILARAIVSDGACPALTVDGTLNVPMKVRVSASQLTNTPGTNTPSGASNSTNTTAGYPQYFVNPNATAPANFPDGTAKATTSWAECEAVVPAGHAKAIITGTSGATTLKLPIANPQRMLVIGDIGCRMAGSNQQDCHSPNVTANGKLGFPLPVLAPYEAQFGPDLVVEAGDWFYRDTSCVAPGSGEYVAGCSDPSNAAYETWGDTWDSWNADVFYPAKSLLAAAPWVMARGNHESCGRGARGWFALLDPHPFDINLVKCAYKVGATAVTSAAVYTGDFTPSYVVPAGTVPTGSGPVNVNLIVHDSSYANDSTVDANMAKNYDYDLTALLGAVPGNQYYIFLTHKPTYGLTSSAPTNSGDFTEQFLFSGNATSNSAFSGGVPYKIPLFLAGHIHMMQYVNFDDYTHYAPQLIVGVGGDNLDPLIAPPNLTYAYQSQAFTVHNASSTGTTTTATVNHAYSQAEFGFALLTPMTNGYIANVYNTYSTKAGRCTITLSPRNIACWN